MAIDVSIYTLRVKDGYLSTTTGGTLRSLGSSPYSSSQSGGTASGVVRTTGDQRVIGLKYWDASANFTYDVCIGQDLIVNGNIYGNILGKFGKITVNGDASVTGELYVDDRNINDWDDAQDVSIAWLLSNKLPSDSSLSDLSDVNTSSVSSAQDGSALVWNNATSTWVAGVAGGAGSTTLEDLTDTSISSLSNNDFLLYNASDSVWNNIVPVELMSFGAKGSSDVGIMGDLAYDSSYFYICTSTNTWIRILGEGGY